VAKKTAGNLLARTFGILVEWSLEGIDEAVSPAGWSEADMIGLFGRRATSHVDVDEESLLGKPSSIAFDSFGQIPNRSHCLLSWKANIFPSM
jgi:hypothetical protein